MKLHVLLILLSTALALDVLETTRSSLALVFDYFLEVLLRFAGWFHRTLSPSYLVKAIEHHVEAVTVRS